MALSIPRVRHYLKSFALEKLFIEELGWDRHSARLPVQAGEDSYTLEGVAEKRGVQIFNCQPGPDGMIPDYETRRKIEKQVTKSAYEHLIIFLDAAQTMQIWQWVSRQPGQPAAYREHHYQAQHHSGDSLIQKLEAITFTLNEEEGLTLTGVVFRLHDAFDRDRVTKRFYDLFKKEHKVFLDFIKGITEQGDREWYASLMLNRLMFVYFIQRKGFLDGDWEYLENRLKLVQERKGKDNFLTFYRYFLIRLFHEGFSQQPAQRAPELEELLGEVPYLDGGLFELHELEQRYPDIDIPDEAFERLFDFFDQYEWHLDTRPLRNDREINPDVLGYIFEKYINQKQMGAYYTKEDITEYISKNTIIPFLFDAAEKKCAIAFQPDSALWQLLRNDPDRYIFPAVRKGVIDENGDVIPLTYEIEKGIHNVKERREWNSPADPEYSLPTETWREHVARRQRCLEIREKLTRGEIHQINNLITFNLDIRQFVQDVITNCEGPELLRAFYKAISTVTILDPTCGSGAFLFAALNILEPLYEGCLDRMQAFLDDLDRSGERHRPEKFSDFRRTLAEIERHPNRPYFILKSIIVNNLYGVDIMQEAVEICKLRLFLKLVAQVDKVKQLEPLPDIDFNIRAGNSLVGFARLIDVKSTLEDRLPFYKDQVNRIVEDAEVVERAFQRFQEMQIERNMNTIEFSEAKKEIRDRLDKLTAELDQYAALEYGIDIENEKAYNAWRNNHQPFHWLADFYKIMRQGGFDIVIGNPPYVQYKDVKSTYTVRNFSTFPCADLYAFVTEKCYVLTKKRGRIGLIIPISIFGVDGFISLQKETLNNVNPIWISSFANRPSQLFDGSQKRLTILLGFRSSKSKINIFTSRYYRWFREERDVLFSAKIEYIHRTSCFLVFPSSLEKIGSSIELETFIKIASNKATLARDILKTSSHQVFYTRKFGYFLAFLDVIPQIIEIDTGIPSQPSELKSLYFSDSDSVFCAIAGLSSSTFFWFWNVLSDCRNLNRRDILSFPLSPNRVNKEIGKSLNKLGRSYINALKKTSQFMQKSGLKIETFGYAECKNLIDKIDTKLSQIYGLTNEEQDFVINYDIKYRIR